MGRGRQKAKQTKIARKLKYLTTDTDYDELAKELSGQEEPVVSKPKADAFERVDKEFKQDEDLDEYARWAAEAAAKAEQQEKVAAKPTAGPKKPAVNPLLKVAMATVSEASDAGSSKAKAPAAAGAGKPAATKAKTAVKPKSSAKTTTKSGAKSATKPAKPAAKKGTANATKPRQTKAVKPPAAE